MSSAASVISSMNILSVLASLAADCSVLLQVPSTSVDNGRSSPSALCERSHSSATLTKSSGRISITSVCSPCKHRTGTECSRQSEKCRCASHALLSVSGGTLSLPTFMLVTQRTILLSLSAEEISARQDSLCHVHGTRVFAEARNAQAHIVSEEPRFLTTALMASLRSCNPMPSSLAA